MSMSRRHSWTIAAVALVFFVGLALGTRLTVAQSPGRAGSPDAAPAPLQPEGGPARARPVDTHLFRTIAAQQNPSVVFVTTESKVRVDVPPLFDDEFFRRFFGVPPVRPRDQVRRGVGSGFVIDAGGDILTNNHVVEGADRIRVALFPDGSKQYEARVIGRDRLTDTALVRLEQRPAGLRSAVLGDSDALQPGDWVMAIGNPFNLGHTVTVGVVSYQGRPFETSEGRFQKMIQTDASINPGNSGGPLIDTDGRVVGINTAILGSGAGGNIGIGFAVPIDTVKALLPQLRAGRVVRGRLGVRVSPVGEDEAEALALPSAEGAIVRQVEEASPAERAALRPGDVIVEYDGRPVRSPDDLVAMVSATRPGARVSMTVLRDGRRQSVSATIEELQGAQTPDASQDATLGFGLTLADLTPALAERLGVRGAARGAVIDDVEPGSPAEEAGLQVGDVILQVNRRAVRDAAEATAAIRQSRSAVVFLLVSRRGTELFVSMRRR
jgi:serine protease Do